MDARIAVDIGGTQIRAACYPDDSLKPLIQQRSSTQQPGKTALQSMFDAIAAVWPEGANVLKIAVAAPGPIDSKKGMILAAPNIPGWYNLPLKSELERHFNTPAAIGNDANLAALGEYRFGAGQGHHYLIYLTISTGIGSGIIIADRLIEGAHGLGGELGHITVLPDGPLCGCGKRGHLEAVAAGPGIARWVQEQLANGEASSLAPGAGLSAKDVAMAAAAGDLLSLRAMQRAGAFIGYALADFLHIFNPTIVIFGGGVSKAGALLFDPVRKALEERVLSPGYLQDLSLTTAALGDEAGLMGALALARSQMYGLED
jgi:glucokinase